MTDRAWLVLSRWQVELLSHALDIPEAEVYQLVGAFNPNTPAPTGPCECNRIPWNPHRRRFTLGEERREA